MWPGSKGWLRADITSRGSVIGERLPAEFGFTGSYQRVKMFLAGARPRIASELEDAARPQPVRRARAAETRRRITDAAFDSFATRGYQGTTMAAVARLAKVAEPMMYFSFGSKAALLREVMIARRNRKGGPTDVAAQSWIQDVLRT